MGITRTKPSYSSALSSIFGILDADSFAEMSKLSACGVITGYGACEGRLLYVFSQYGPVDALHAEKIASLYDAATKMGAPVVGIFDSCGMDLSSGLETLAAYGKIFQTMSSASGVVPQIAIVSGECLGLHSLLPTLSDFVVMPESDALLMLASPSTLLGEEAKTTAHFVSSSAKAHATKTGLAHFITTTQGEALDLTRQLLSFLPSNNLDDAPMGIFADDLNRVEPNMQAASPHQLIASIADKEQFLEVQKGFEDDVLIGFLRLNGYSVGVIFSGGPLTPIGLEKMARHVHFCDAFNIPILSFVKGEGLAYTLPQQSAMLKQTAKLIYTLCSATVPKVNVVVGDLFGSSALLLNSKPLGADIGFIWNQANVAIINPKAADALRLQSSSPKSDHSDQAFFADDTIEPSCTRKAIVNAFEMLHSKRVVGQNKKHKSVLL